jgi:uncharacterized membrane protein YczE
VSSWLWIITVWLVTTAVTTLIAGAILVSAPKDYLTEGDTRQRHWTFRIIRSVIGVLLIAIGLVLSLPGVPGQGVLTILAGVMLIEFPGRHRIVRAIIGRPLMLAAVNRLRARFKRPPLAS